MANYTSSLTGNQIDNVMNQIDQGVPEGWAVGEKNGVPVSSSSVYYHNNAKYYAENAQGSAARAEAAVPSGTAGAVFFDRSQSLTDAQKVQAKRNISAGSTNPNILDNWYFADGLVINSRGVTSGDFGSGVYRMDRWQTTWGTSPTGGTWSLSNDGLTITSTQGGVYFRQPVHNQSQLVGKLITCSVMLANGDIYSGSITRTSTTQAVSHGLTGFWMGFEGTMFRFGVGVTGNSFTVKAIKLEIGGVSTLANDAPPTYNEELVKCITSKANTTDQYTNMVVTATSNPNLLDNWWFMQGARVNQRGVYSYPSVSSATYCIDRWLYNRATISVNDAGLAFAWNGVDGENGNIQQFTGRDLRNKLLTCSAVIGGTLYSHTFYFTGSSTVTYDFMVSGVKWRWQLDHSAGAASGATSTRLVLISFDTTARTISRMKLEVGAVSTLLLDAPPSYAEELAKCQYYFRRIQASTGIAVGFGFMAAPTSGYISIPATMRTSGTISCAISGSATLRGAGVSGTVTAITVAGHAKEFVRLNATISGSIAGNNPAVLVLDTNAYIDLSADL